MSELLIFDGAMGTLLQKYGYKTCFPSLNIENPKLIMELHKLYLSAGAKVIKTNTFNADINSLKKCNQLKNIREINKKAVILAKNAISSLNLEQKSYIAGDIGPSISRYYEVDNDIFIESAYIQTIEFLKGGVDFIILETMISLKEVKLLLKGIKRAFEELDIKKELIISISPNKNGDFILDGELKELEKIDMVNYIGLNCGSGFSSFFMGMEKFKKIDYLAPSLGLPLKKNDEFIYQKSPKSFVDEVLKLKSDKNIKFLGGCCGTNPEYIKALSDELN